MRLPSSPVPRWLLAAIVSTLAVGCAGGVDPSNPVAPAGVAPAVSHEPLVPRPPAAGTAVATGHPTPLELTNRGWTCFTPPVPNRIVCSHPNQGFPVVGTPPPENRPATYTLWVFDGSGRFTGTELLVRTDLYRGQICESTREPYVFVPIIGYYECVHTPGR